MAGDRDTLAAIERAMIQIRRSMTRRALGRRVAQETGRTLDPALAGAVDAVDEGPEQPGQELTVGLVAERMGIDPSRASRVVTAAITAGYLRRVASQTDGRRIQLELTDTGRELVTTSHHFRQSFYERLMHDWPERDQAEFARLLGRFTAAMTELRRQDG